jgi:hypothetical protein
MNEWEVLTFNFSAVNLENEYQKVVVFFDFGNSGDSSVYYFDDIELISPSELSYSVTFTVVDENELALADAEVIFNEITLNTDVNGVATFTSVSPTIDAPYIITKAGYIEASGKVTVIDADVELTVGLIGVGISNQISIVSNIYPNPTNGVITIQLASDVSEASVELFDLNGRMVMKKSLYRMETTLDVSDNKAGIYLIKVVTEHNQFNGKIVLSK